MKAIVRFFAYWFARTERCPSATCENGLQVFDLPEGRFKLPCHTCRGTGRVRS